MSVVLSTKLKNAINNVATTENIEFSVKNIILNGVKRGCSGFIKNKDNGSVVYINTEPCWLDLVPPFMYRYAKDTKDYTGYHNRYARTLDELAVSVVSMLHKTPEAAGDVRI